MTPRPKIKRNRAQCLSCFSIVESKSVHDFARCKCGKIFVDGGLEYLRRGADSWDNFLDLSEE